MRFETNEERRESARKANDSIKRFRIFPDNRSVATRGLAREGFGVPRRNKVRVSMRSGPERFVVWDRWAWECEALRKVTSDSHSVT